MKLSITALIFTTASSAATLPTTPPPVFDWGTLHCPPFSSNSTLPTPTYGFSSRIWTICAELTIRAPPTVVYNALIDYQSYHLWNTFVAEVFGFPINVTSTPEDVYIGMPMSFTVAGLPTDSDSTSESQEVVTILQPKPIKGVRSKYIMNAWRSDTYFDQDGGNRELVKAEHPNILTPVGGGEWTRYVSYETYYEGQSSDAIFPLRERLQELFERQGRELKAYIEQGRR